MIIPGYSRYDITKDGVVTEISTGKVINAHIVHVNTGYTYRRVFITDDCGVKKQVPVIKLLAIAYLGVPERPSIARTKDGDNTNTVLDNVEWVPRRSHSCVQSRRNTRRRKKTCYDENSIALVHETLKELGEPRSVAALSRILDLPYSIVRYSVYALIERGIVHRVVDGVEVL